MTTTITREELETRYQRARHKIRHQRIELRHLNKSILFQQSMWRDAHKQVDHFKQLWWEATHGAGYRYGWEPKPVIVTKTAWLPIFAALATGLLLGYLA